MSKYEVRNSPHLRHYGIALTSSKTDFSRVRPSKDALRMIEELQPYVEADDGAKGTPLCWIIHEEGRVCCQLEGHE